MSTPDPTFFSSRGIPEAIWKARPYVWWTPEYPEPAKAPFADLGAPQRAFVTKLANQSAGWLISRQPPPMNPRCLISSRAPAARPGPDARTDNALAR